MTNEEYNELKSKIVIKPCTIVMEFGEVKRFEFHIPRETKAIIVADMMLDRIVDEAKKEIGNNKIALNLVTVFVGFQIAELLIKTMNEQRDL